MSNIEGLIGSLRDSRISEYGSIKPYTESIIQIIDQFINRFQDTILDLTDISKAQKHDEDVQTINCLEIIEDVKGSINAKIVELQAKIDVNISEINTIKFSKNNFKSIIYNLVSNAIKYQAPERTPEIFIKTEDLGDFILLWVKDNGMGIINQNMGKIFGMFKRVHDHVEGTGIGLVHCEAND